MSCSLSDTYDVTSTLRWCIASQYGLAPLHPLLFSVLLVVPGHALASVSPDGERSVNFVLQWSYFMYKFVTKVKDLVILLGDRVYSDHHVFVILLAII